MKICISFYIFLTYSRRIDAHIENMLNLIYTYVLYFGNLVSFQLHCYFSMEHCPKTISNKHFPTYGLTKIDFNRTKFCPIIWIDFTYDMLYIVIKYNEIRQQCFKTSNHNETTLIAFYPNKNFPYPCLINYCLEDHKSTLLIFLSISSRANAMSIQVDMVENEDFNLAIRKTWDSVSAQIQIE